MKFSYKLPNNLHQAQKQIYSLIQSNRILQHELETQTSNNKDLHNEILLLKANNTLQQESLFNFQNKVARYISLLTIISIIFTIYITHRLGILQLLEPYIINLNTLYILAATLVIFMSVILCFIAKSFLVRTILDA